MELTFVTLINRPKLVLLLALPLLFLHCGPAENITTEDPAGSLKYFLDRAATNKLTNALNLIIPDAVSYTFSIDGEGFEADVEKKKAHTPKSKLALTYSDKTTYSMQLRIFQSDGAVLIKDEMTWEYSDEVPPAPDIIFEEEATSDTKVNLVASTARGKNTKELWVEGDVPDSEKGWHTIPETGVVPIVVTEADGIKNITVHYRNIFGTEGSSLDLSILKKSVGPINCSISSNTLITATGIVKFEVSATNDGPLYYAAIGDVSGTGAYTKFTALTTFDGTLLATTNKVKIRVRDVASNFCPDKDFTLTYDAAHLSQSITVLNNALWTDTPTITVLPTLDYLPSDTVLMYLYGDIVSDANTVQWLTYSASTSVQLNPSDGNRAVRVKYKVNGTLGDEQLVLIYLKPFISLQGSSSPFTLVPSEFAKISSMTITGCSQTYSAVAFSSTLPCTASTGTTISATYNLPDGTSVARTVVAP